jgi:hypothetical protein
MLDFLDTPMARYVLLFAGMAALLAIGFYIIQKLRSNLKDNLPSASDYISHFRELRSQGKLTDEEYRTIKTQLAKKLQDELKDAGSES